METKNTNRFQRTTNIRIPLTITVTILIFALLIWQHFHGGVPSHHILHQADLPSISNWWGGLLLPVLTWVLSDKIQNRWRVLDPVVAGVPSNSPISKISSRFILGILVAVLISVSFMYEIKGILDNTLYILLILCLVIPVFYSEFILGFILGMTFTFGAVLPTVFMSIWALFGYLLFRFVRPVFITIIAKFKGSSA